MSKELFFASEELACNYLAELTGSRVLIAKSLEDMMPNLKERFKSRIRKKMEDEEIEETIVDLAKMDPKFDGNMKKNPKSIHTLLNWYFKDPNIFDDKENNTTIRKSLQRFNILRGQGHTKKNIKEFKRVDDMLQYVNETEMEVKKKKEEDVKTQFLAKPKLSMNGLKAYYINEDWDDLGKYLFEKQTKWCVNNEGSYEGYRPLWLFTQDNGSYYALFSPSENMFNNANNEELYKEEIENLMPLIVKLDLEEEFERVGIEAEPPYDEQFEYESRAWENWVELDFSSELDKIFKDKINDYKEKFGEDSIDEPSKLNTYELFKFFQEIIENSDIDWEWERNQDRTWEVSVDYYSAAKKVKWEKLVPFLVGGLHKEIAENNLDIDINKYPKKEVERLRKQYPKLFKELAEKHGQTKIFNGTNEALQYLADFLGKRIIISKDKNKFIPPKGAQNAAKKVLKWKEKYPKEVKAMTRTGWTRARQLASGDPISLDIVKRMAKFYRHKSNSEINPKYKNTPWKDNGYSAWLGWGGDSGINWAKRIVKGLNNE